MQCAACGGTGQIPCGTCGGNGYLMQTCATCGGTGVADDYVGSPLEDVSPIALAAFRQDGTVGFGYCPGCGGGRQNPFTCGTCGGTG